MKETLLLFYMLILLSQPVISQVLGGKTSFEFLNSPASSRITALGGTLLSVKDDDASLAFINPAALNAAMSGQFHFSHNIHFADITQGAFNTAKTFKTLGIHSHLGILYTSYGNFRLSDEIGNIQGDFKANELAIVLGSSKQLNERVSIGANIKFVTSNLESYTANAVATDIAIMYVKKASKFSTTFLIRNIGFALSSYTSQKLSLPLDIQIGISKQLAHLPLRLSITAVQLQQWNIRYDDPSQVAAIDLFGESTESSQLSKNIDNLFRHLVFSGEFLLGKKENLKLRLGYSHLRRRELSLSEFRSLAGYSIGFGMKVSKFKIDYGLGYHHLAGASNHISISTNLTEYRKKL